MYESSTALVLDNGSGVCKIGFAADEAPKSVFSAIVGKPRNPGIIIGTEQKDAYIGDEAQAKRGVVHMRYPIEHGIVVHWDDMERIWNHAFQNELRTVTDDHQVLITEASLNPRENREKMTQLMFDKFNINAFYVGNQSVFSLYSIGKLSGIVLYSGDGVTHCDPIFEGYAIPHAIQRIDIAGRDVTNLLSKLLAEKGVILNNSAELQIVREIKEKMCFVSSDYNTEINQNSSTEIYRLPDDNILDIGNERFRATEIMFNPELFGYENPSIEKLAYNSIMNCDIDFRKYMIENVIVSGGNTMHPGFIERLNSELGKMLNNFKDQNINLKVKGANERKFSAWIGASILAGLSSFQQMWITKAEYEESGASVIHKKCLS